MTLREQKILVLTQLRELFGPTQEQRNWNKSENLPDLSVEDDYEFLIDEEQNIINQKLQLINDAISYHLTKNPKLRTDMDLFKMCYTKNMSLREISKATRIPLTSVYQYVLNVEMLVKSYIKNKTQRIK